MSTRTRVCGLAALAVTGLMATSVQAAEMTRTGWTKTATSNASAYAFHVVTSGATEARFAAPALGLGTYTRSFDAYFAPLPDPAVADAWWQLNADYRYNGTVPYNDSYNVTVTGSGTSASQWYHFSQTFTVTDATD